MAPVRLRHPKGVATIQVPFDKSDYSVSDLQQEIYTASGILPSRQNLKSGYPPQSLTLISELPLSSLGLKPGDQLIVGEAVNQSSSAKSVPSSASTTRQQAASTSILSGLSSSGPISSTVPTTSPEHVATEGGILIHRVVPDDNSCLFSSVALIFAQDITKAPRMREIVAEGILKDPETYNEAILGMPPSKYVDTILKPATWGGAIELSVLASHWGTEICSVDVETGRVDHFAPLSGGSGTRCILVYSGIHYDAATLAPTLDAPAEWHQTVFPVQSGSDESDAVIAAAKKLADALRAKKAFTNTATFDLKCEDCGQGLKGEKGARAHAEQTGHVRFGEY